MRALSRDNGPAIVWVRVGNTTTRALVAVFDSVLAGVIAAIERGEIFKFLSADFHAAAATGAARSGAFVPPPMNSAATAAPRHSVPDSMNAAM